MSPRVRKLANLQLLLWNVCSGSLCLCATVTAPHWLGRLPLWLAFCLKMWNDTDRKKKIPFLLRTRPETRLALESTVVSGVRSIVVLLLTKPLLLTPGFSTTCPCLLRMSDLGSQHLLPPQSLTALSFHYAPCIADRVFEASRRGLWRHDSMQITIWVYAKSFMFGLCENEETKSGWVFFWLFFAESFQEVTTTSLQFNFNLNFAQLW